MSDPLARWSVVAGDILDVPADVLVCSANVWLNLSGGVGGAILLRHGDAMQRELHRWLADRGRRHAKPGTVVRTGPHGLAVGAVLHAVAVDGFYQTSAERVQGCVSTSLSMAAELGARRVAMTALATGFGRLSVADFAAAVRPLVGVPCPPVEAVVVGVRHAEERDAVAAGLGVAAGVARSGG